MAEEIPLIKPKDFPMTCEDGTVKNYILSRFDAIAGREIICKYISFNLPKLGDYPEGEKVMLQLMSHVAVKTKEGVEIKLSTKDLIRNHCPDGYEQLMKLEGAMMEYNSSFFQDGRSLDFFENLAQLIARKALEILTPLSEQLSPTTKQPSTNSEQSMT